MKDKLRKWLPVVGLVVLGGCGAKVVYDFATGAQANSPVPEPTAEVLNQNLVVAGGAESNPEPGVQPTQDVIISTQPPVDSNGLIYKGNESCRIVAKTGEVFYISLGRPSTVQGHICLGRDGDGLNWWLANENKVGYDLNLNGVFDKAIVQTKD